MHWNIIFGIFLVLSACGDFVEESGTSACNSAIDARNYDEALSVCTSRKDQASAYMGKAGYDIINLLKSSGTTIDEHSEPEYAKLGKDDITGATILNILQLGPDVIDNDVERATKISRSRTNLDSASALLQPHLTDKSPLLSTDEILLNTFAISFAMQLNQLEVYDCSTATTTTYPIQCTGCTHVDNLTCVTVDNSTSDSDAQAKLKAMDGHLWTTERNSSQCNSILSAINGLSGQEKTNAFTNFTTWVDNDTYGKLPEPFDTLVCGPIVTLTNYLTNLTANIEKLGNIISGNNTKAIKSSQTSSDELLKAVHCK